MRILSFDPGRQNFAFSALSNGKLQDHGFVRAISDLRPEALKDELTRFLTDVTQLIDRHNPALVIIERMQHRPHQGGGAVSEYINLMIGAILTRLHDRGCRTILVMPCTWKSHFKRLFGIKGRDLFTTVGQKMVIKAKPGPDNPKGHKTKTVWVDGILDPQLKAKEIEISVHEGDALGIAAYGWYCMTRIDVIKNVVT